MSQQMHKDRLGFLLKSCRCWEKPKFFSHSLAMSMSPYEWSNIQWNVKQQTMKKKSVNLWNWNFVGLNKKNLGGRLLEDLVLGLPDTAVSVRAEDLFMLKCSKAGHRNELYNDSKMKNKLRWKPAKDYYWIVFLVCYCFNYKTYYIYHSQMWLVNPFKCLIFYLHILIHQIISLSM